MATVDLRSFEDSDSFVIHFGGRPNEVNTYTFANAIVAFSDTFREINAQVNNSQSIELRLEAVGKGSFRGKIKGVPKTIMGALKFTANAAILPLLMAFIYDHYIDDDTFEIEISDDYVIIKQGNDRTIIPKSAYDASKAIPSPEKIHNKFNATIDAVEEDVGIESFGLTINLGDEVPIINLERKNWPAIREHRTSLVREEKMRVTQEEVTLSILKAIFAKSHRKWEFVWRGVKVSAFVEDPIFIADIVSGRQKIGNGDTVKCLLEISQEWSETDRVWLNSSYSIKEVIEYVPFTSDEKFLE